MTHASALYGLVGATGRYVHLLIDILRAAPRRPFQTHSLLRQIHFIGARALPIITVAGFFIGAVVAVQFYETLVRFGSRALLGTAVGLSLIRELGPILTGLLIIGRAGSACCAEVAVMRAEQQIDALECMGIDSTHYLVVPRWLAFFVVTPLLTGIFVVAAIAGSAMVCGLSFGESVPQFLANMSRGITDRDLVLGLVKGLTFGVLIGWCVLAKGYFSDGLHGAEGVSRTTTEAVVLASLAILFFDYVLSALLLNAE
jgi:phospholipid/cholesterol/gamma-HCH transport system permease protein